MQFDVAPVSSGPRTIRNFSAPASARAAAGAVPATVTVTVFVSTWLLGPRAVSVYVVVADGFSCRLPRGMTRPGSGSMVTPAGFSVCQMSVNDCPGLIDAGWAEKSRILAGSSLAFPYADPSNPADTAPGALGDAWPAGA